MPGRVRPDPLISLRLHCRSALHGHPVEITTSCRTPYRNSRRAPAYVRTRYRNSKICRSASRGALPQVHLAPKARGQSRSLERVRAPRALGGEPPSKTAFWSGHKPQATRVRRSVALVSCSCTASSLLPDRVNNCSQDQKRQHGPSREHRSHQETCQANLQESYGKSSNGELIAGT